MTRQGEAAGESGFSNLDEVLACDAVCLHAPLVNQGPWPTHHLLDARRVEALRSDQILISAGRGAVVDNQALYERLQAPDGGPWTALDVWENEPGLTPAWLNGSVLARPTLPATALRANCGGRP